MTDTSELYTWAANACACREYCCNDIRHKLFLKKASPAQVAAVCRRLTDEGFIDEERYAQAFIHDKLSFAHWGRMKIRYELLCKQLEESLIDRLLATIDEEAYLKALNALLTTRLQQLANEPPLKAKQKAARTALSKGYESHLVMKALDSIEPADADL